VALPRASDFRPGGAGRTRAAGPAGRPARQLVLDVRQTALSAPPGRRRPGTSEDQPGGAERPWPPCRPSRETRPERIPDRCPVEYRITATRELSRGMSWFRTSLCESRGMGSAPYPEGCMLPHRTKHDCSLSERKPGGAHGMRSENLAPPLLRARSQRVVPGHRNSAGS
jgi:hypothetical protein